VTGPMRRRRPHRSGPVSGDAAAGTLPGPPPSRVRAAVLTAGLLLLTGCLTVVPGRQGELSLPPSSVGADEVPIVGADGGAIDELTRNALADLEIFWAQTFPETYGQEFPPLDGGYFSVDPNDIDPSQYPDGVSCGSRPSEVEDNAFYCKAPSEPNSDSISYDRAFLAELAEQFGRFIPDLVMAHEFGHAVQSRVGFPDAAIAAETQADCFAGAWTAWVAAGRAEYTTIRTAELDEVLRGYVQLRDPVGTSLGEKTAHGSYFDRVSAFQEGFAGGVAACRDNFGRDRVFTQEAFVDDVDFYRGGNAPYSEAIGLADTSLAAFWTPVLAQALGGRFEPPTVTSFARRAPACAAAELDLVYCSRENLVGYDEADLTRDAYELGDYAVLTAVAIPYALAVRDQLGRSTDDETALRSAVCLAGTFSYAVYADAVEGIQISPGDIDESVQFLLEYGTDPNVLPATGLTGFELVDVFRTGFVQGLGACDLTR
jgi:predicted metalloprotease